MVFEKKLYRNIYSYKDGGTYTYAKLVSIVLNETLGGMCMAIGFIGAGKVGFSLGRYFVQNGVNVSGYYSKTEASASEAADFTGAAFYGQMSDLIQNSKIIFITATDSAIGQIWEQLKSLHINDKIICHCSGVLSSEIFSDISAYNCSGFSVHPLLAISSRHDSYKELSNALFTIEGSDKAAKDELTTLLTGCGNKVVSIKAEEKPRYHAAAVMASNLVLGLAAAAAEELQKCGFSRKEALDALAPFMQANVAHLSGHTPEEALTGPVERADLATVETHLEKLNGDNREIYRLLSKKALELAKLKNKTRDYEKLEGLLI
jgi:predicted short-subunit dehydrogenase-like oxidoreductase (DUF2520 family)